MTKVQGMGQGKSRWRQSPGTRVLMDLVMVIFLGVVALLLFRHGKAMSAEEGAILMMAAAGLMFVCTHWWEWHRKLTRDGSLTDWLQRTLQGERVPFELSAGMREPERRAAMALNAVIKESQANTRELEGLRQALNRDWRDQEALLKAIQQKHDAEVDVWVQGSTRLAAMGHELKSAFENTLRLDQVELNYRLRADQTRLQGQAFRTTVEQLRSALEQFETHLEELQETFPRLRREEVALGRLADAGMRQGARLALSVKGLVAQTSRLVDDAQSRGEWLRRLRQSTDGLRDRAESLARRLEGFRDEAQSRVRTFGGAQGSLVDLDHVVQETGLLAVNAAILAQQDSGSAGMAAIGGRLRHLADRTAEGAGGMARTLDECQRGLERETSGFWDLQEVAQSLLMEIEELLKVAGHLDHHGQNLELALESHLGLVDQVRQASERAELSLHEMGARAAALESAHGRQWGVEAKLTPEQERLARMSARLEEVGVELARISQQNIDEIWDILAMHQGFRRLEVYRQVMSGGLPRLMERPDEDDPTWNSIAWARAQRRVRYLAGGDAPLPPLGRMAPDGGLRLLLLGQDALSRPEPSVLEAWSCDSTGRAWDLRLLASLCTESHRLGLLALLKDSPLTACFQGLDMHIAPDGVHLRLPHPYPGLPGFLAGLRLEFPVEPDLRDHPYREAVPWTPGIQRVVWMGPNQGGGVQNPCLRLAHAWFRDHPQHERFLTWLPFRGQHPRCPWFGDAPPEGRPAEPFRVRCIGLGADPSTLQPLRDRFLAAGASEGEGGVALCAFGIGHPHPEALLFRLFQSDMDLAGAFHPDLVPYQSRFRDEVLGGAMGDPYEAGWALLQDLQRAGWLMPVPPDDQV